MLPNLKILNISRLSVTLVTIDVMPSLEKLEGQELDHITDERMGRLINLAPNLQYLDVSASSITPNLFIIANSIMKTRGNDIMLKIITSEYVNALDMEQLSPLLNIEFCGERTNGPSLPFDDLYDDVNDDNEDGIYNEDLNDFEDDHEFEMF